VPDSSDAEDEGGEEGGDDEASVDNDQGIEAIVLEETRKQRLHCRVAAEEEEKAHAQVDRLPQFLYKISSNEPLVGM